MNIAFFLTPKSQVAYIREGSSIRQGLEMLRPYVTDRTKALVINTPNNPNGCIWSRAELQAAISRLSVIQGVSEVKRPGV